jgi:hypothetical protein
MHPDDIYGIRININSVRINVRVSGCAESVLTVSFAAGNRVGDGERN